jgi:hypothetical protein
VQALLRKGANSNAAPEKSSPPLHLAPGHDSPAGLLRLLLAAGADPNGRNSVGQTPLHYAVASDSPAGKAAIDILLAAGADPSAKDAVGQTPLEFAQSFPPMSLAARHLQKVLVSRQAPLQCLGLGLWGLRAGATRRGWAPGYCVLTNQIFCLQANRCVGDHLAGAGSRWIWLLLWCQQRWDPSCEPGAFSIAGCPGGWGTAAAAAAAATAAAAAPDAAAGAAWRCCCLYVPSFLMRKVLTGRCAAPAGLRPHDGRQRHQGLQAGHGGCCSIGSPSELWQAAGCCSGSCAAANAYGKPNSTHPLVCAVALQGGEGGGGRSGASRKRITGSAVRDAARATALAQLEVSLLCVSG